MCIAIVKPTQVFRPLHIDFIVGSRQFAFEGQRWLRASLAKIHQDGNVFARLNQKEGIRALTQAEVDGLWNTRVHADGGCAVGSYVVFSCMIPFIHIIRRVKDFQCGASIWHVVEYLDLNVGGVIAEIGVGKLLPVWVGHIPPLLWHIRDEVILTLSDVAERPRSAADVCQLAAVETAS